MELGIIQHQNHPHNALPPFPFMSPEETQMDKSFGWRIVTELGCGPSAEILASHLGNQPSLRSWLNKERQQSTAW